MIANLANLYKQILKLNCLQTINPISTTAQTVYLHATRKRSNVIDQYYTACKRTTNENQL